MQNQEEVLKIQAWLVGRLVKIGKIAIRDAVRIANAAFAAHQVRSLEDWNDIDKRREVYETLCNHPEVLVMGQHKEF